MATTRSRRKTGVSGTSLKNFTNFNGIQGDAIKAISLVGGMVAGKFVKDNAVSLLNKTGNVGNGVNGLLGNSKAAQLAGTTVETLKKALPALLLTGGGFMLKKNMKNQVLKDMALGMMAYGGASMANDLFKFNIIGKLQGLNGGKSLKGLYAYRDRPRMLAPASTPQTAPAPPVASPVNRPMRAM
jgi:hypothetical protein